MKLIVGVRFCDAGKTYYFDPGELDLKYGDTVLVDTGDKPEYGRVVLEAQQLENDNVYGELKKVIKKADNPEEEQPEADSQKKAEAFSVCEEKIREHRLDMKLIDIEHSKDSAKMIFYFTADGRVDFRELVKDLASVFRTRIELRQIGVRDEARKIGGLGPCGRPCCCNAFLNDFQPVSIKMAKEQNLSLSPTKISGLCGRLMCCLNYENDFYKDVRKRMPRVGAEVITPDGHGEAVECNSLRETVNVKIELPDGTFDVRPYPAAELKWKGRQNKCAINDTDVPLETNANKEADFI